MSYKFMLAHQRYVRMYRRVNGTWYAYNEVCKACDNILAAHHASLDPKRAEMLFICPTSKFTPHERGPQKKGKYRQGSPIPTT